MDDHKVYNFPKEEFSSADLEELFAKAENGDAAIQYKLANYYDDGIYIDGELLLKPDSAKAFEYTKLALKNGDKSASIAYANRLQSSESCEKDEKLDILVYKRAIKNKQGVGAYNL